jgi:hypothetical protein
MKHWELQMVRHLG